MDERALWIVANVVNVLSLGVIIALLDARRKRALLELPRNIDVPESVRQQRALNARVAHYHIIFYGGLLLLGAAMLLGGAAWSSFTAGPVPAIIPGGTIFFAAIYLAKAVATLWEARRREQILELAKREALARAGVRAA